MKTALLVGGTAATGIAIAAELRERGYQVTIYHRGEHEVPALDDLEHIHGDPHHAQTIDHDLQGREWDVTVATYGRIRHLAEALRGRTGQFVSISGMPVVGMVKGVPVTEEAPYETEEHAPAGLKRLFPRIVETERAVLEAHSRNDFVATVVRYPYVYGPHAVAPLEWHVMRRVLDGRRRWILQDGGLALTGRCASPNAARLVGLVLDRPLTAGGEIYHAADSQQFTQREWIDMVAAAMGHQFRYVDIPPSLVPLGCSAVPMASEHSWTRSIDVETSRLRHVLVSNEKARTELDYADAVDPWDWIRETVRHWQEHPPTVDGQSGRLGPNDFDYESEDRLLAHWDRVKAQMPYFGGSAPRSHPYAHPPAASPQADPA